MRHRIAHRKLGRTMEHRKALRRNMVQSLFEHGQIQTTLQKAKDLRPFAERLITLARKAREGDLGARRRIHRLMGERFFIARENQEAYDDMSDAQRRAVQKSRNGRHHRTGAARGALPFTSEAISFRLINTIAERYDGRPGGYTRVIRLARRRIGDQGEQAIIQLLGEEEVPTDVPRAKKTARHRRISARYAAVRKATRPSGAGKAAAKPAPAPDPEPQSEST